MKVHGTARHSGEWGRIGQSVALSSLHARTKSGGEQRFDEIGHGCETKAQSPPGSTSLPRITASCAGTKGGSSILPRKNESVVEGRRVSEYVMSVDTTSFRRENSGDHKIQYKGPPCPGCSQRAGRMTDIATLRPDTGYDACTQATAGGGAFRERQQNRGARMTRHLQVPLRGQKRAKKVPIRCRLREAVPVPEAARTCVGRRGERPARGQPGATSEAN